MTDWFDLWLAERGEAILWPLAPERRPADLLPEDLDWLAGMLYAGEIDPSAWWEIPAVSGATRWSAAPGGRSQCRDNYDIWGASLLSDVRPGHLLASLTDPCAGPWRVQTCFLA